MKIKCLACKGKGGFYPTGKRVIVGLWITCTQCKGKGSWYNNYSSGKKSDTKGSKRKIK